jgi:hypothetical protein
MSSDKEIFAALRALAEEDRAKEAPAEVEQRLRIAFQRKHRRPVWRWSIAAAAAIVLMIAAVYFRPKPAEPVRVVLDPPKVEHTVVVETLPKPVGQVAHVARRRIPREIVTDFFPLMDAPPPLDRAALMRVNVPASAMRTVGLPVREDRLYERVQADVLVSEEGLATAIRFVKYQ